MKADKIRIYAQVLEQGLDFKSYIEKAGFKGEITIAYAKKALRALTPPTAWSKGYAGSRT